jgi:hypothetical protein
MSQRNLVQTVGTSTGSVHYVLKALVGKGLVKLGNFTASELITFYSGAFLTRGMDV